MTDIFDFWAECPPDANCHPADEATLARFGDVFRLDVPPSPIKGPLKKARLVLLALAPGFADQDAEQSLSPSGKAYTVQSRSGAEPLPTSDVHAGTARWVTRIVKPFGIDYADARDKVAVLNIGAYHTKDFQAWAMLPALASSRASLAWAQDMLFPRAEREECVVVCLRSAEHWGLTPGKRYKGHLYAPRTVRSGHMRVGDEHAELRSEIIDAAREAIGAA